MFMRKRKAFLLILHRRNDDVSVGEVERIGI